MERYATVAVGMRSSRTTPCLASSARCHIVIEHEGAGQGARGQGAPRLSPLLAPPTLRCDGGDGSAESATAARASELDATTRPARSGRCGGATAAVAVRRLQRGAQQCRGSDARPRRRRGRLAFIRCGRVRRRAHRVWWRGGKGSVATRRNSSALLAPRPGRPRAPRAAGLGGRALLAPRLRRPSAPRAAASAAMRSRRAATSAAARSSRRGP